MTPIILIAAMLAMAAAAAGSVMPGVAALIGTSVVVTQIIKRGVNAIEFGWLERILVQKAGAVVLAALAAVGVVVFYAVKSQTPFDENLLLTAGQVIIGAPMLKKIFSKKK